MHQEELKIIAAFKQRKDAKAFAYLYKLHFRPLCYFAERLLGDMQDAEDIVTDQFMKLWNKHADFDSFSSIKAFLYISTRNGCVNFLKHSKVVSAYQKEVSYLSEGKDVEILHLMMEAELAHQLAKEIEVLPKTPRRIFELSYFDGLDNKEVSVQLGLSVKTIRNQKAKAVQLIKTALLKKKLLYFLMLIFSRTL